MWAIVKGSPFFIKAKRRGVLDENPKKSAWKCKYN